jgi:hypothetical protein
MHDVSPALQVCLVERYVRVQTGHIQTGHVQTGHDICLSRRLLVIASSALDALFRAFPQEIAEPILFSAGMRESPL